MNLVYNGFEAGLLGREVDGRLDLPQYYKGSRLQQNFVSKPSGGARLRPGTEYISGAPTVTIAGSTEVAETYTYTWINQNGALYGAPLGDGILKSSLDVSGAAVNVGGGVVGLPYTGHPFAVGQVVLIAGTTNYNGTYTLAASTTANRLDITAAYIAETFSGDETVVRVITTTAGTARMVKDSSGNLWVGHNWDAGNATAVTKVAPDGTLTYNALTWNPVPGVNSTVVGMAFSSDESYLYVVTKVSAARIYKFNVSTGAVEWSVVVTYTSGYDITVDGSDNVYLDTGLPTAATIYKYDADTGAGAALTSMGTPGGGVSGGFNWALETNDDGDLVVAGGQEYCLTSAGGATIASMVNFGVRTPDNTKGATMLLGSTYASGSVTYTDRISSASIAVSSDGYIYVLTTGSATKIHKLYWDGSSLSLITSVAGPTHGAGLYIDLYGNIVVVNQQVYGGQTDVFYYYDSNLNNTAILGNFASSFLSLWQAATGNPYQKGGVAFNGVLGVTGTSSRESNASDSSYPIRLIRFVKGTTRYVLEFSHLKMRVYKGGQAADESLVLDGGGNAYTLTTPYEGTDVWSLVFAPKGHAIFHPDFETRRLICNADADWELEEADFVYGPFLDENKDTTKTLTPSATTGSITLTATGHTPFESGHVGSIWRMTHTAPSQTVAEVFTTTTISSEVPTKGTWSLQLDTRFTGSLRLQKSLDGGTTWVDVKVYVYTTNYELHTVDKGEELDDNVLYRVNVDSVTSIDRNSGYSFTVYASERRGIVEITAVTSTSVATATVLTELGNTYATYKWSEGAWSDVRGYPECGTIHESRIFAAKTEYQPNTIWAGATFKRIGDARVMYPDVDDADAFWRTLDLQGCDTIEWLASLWLLLIGANEGVYKGIGASEYTAMTPRNSNFLTQSGMGAGLVQPVFLAGFIVYTSRNEKRVYEMTYSNDTHVYQPEDLTFLNSTIAGTGIKDWAFQQQPYPILWAVTDDGVLIGLTRDRDKGIIAWHQHVTDGEFRSVATIPGDAEDEVWFVVARDVEGTNTAFVERMKPFDWGSAQRDCFFVDGGTTWDGGATVTITDISLSGTQVVVTAASHGFVNGDTVRLASVAGMTEVNSHVYTVADRTTDTFVLKTRDGSGYIDGSAFTAYTSGGTAEKVTNSVTGLTQLASETVVVLLDGQPSTGTVSSAGVYTIGTGKDSYYKNTIHVGREFTGQLEPMWPEVATRSGSIQTQLKKMRNVWLRLYQSAGGTVGTDTNNGRAISYGERGDTVTTDKTLVTEDRPVNHPGGWNRTGQIHIETTLPLPFCVSAIIFEMEQ